MPKDKEVKLTTGQKAVLFKMQEGCILLLDIMGNWECDGRHIFYSVGNFLLQNDLVEYKETILSQRYYTLTETGKTIKL